MEATAVVVIGAGPAGLAVSRCLTGAGVDHVLLERRAVGSSWREERWDSLRTLTPNWMNGLPGGPYRGSDPDGYMSAGEVADSLEHYAAAFEAPVERGVTVRAVKAGSRHHVVETDDGAWRAEAVVMATGPGAPRVPPLATEVPDHIRQRTASEYRNPDELDAERVLIVGASASGVQLADELVRSGREVTLAVGEHVRLPRTYRGRDILWWMQAMGVGARRWDDDLQDLARARRVPSPQLIGTPERRSIDLRALQRGGVALVGRFVGVAGPRFQFAGSLPNLVANADLKQARFLDQVDEFVGAAGMRVTARHRPPRTEVGPSPSSLDADRFDAVLWATGHRYDTPPVEGAPLDRRARLAHDGGVARVPGLFVIGLPFLRRRSSTFLSGIGRDAVELSMEVRRHLARIADAA
jgi:putative flavoprotein involved in K+ transport